MNEAAQEGAGGDHHRATNKGPAIGELDPGHAAIADHQLIGFALDHGEMDGLADRSLHRGGVELPVSLGAGTTDSWSLPAVQHPKLDAAGVRHPPHQTIQSVDLPDQVPFAQTADRGIAGHRADGRELVRDESRPSAHARGYGGGFTAGVATANDDDVVGCQVLGHVSYLAVDGNARKTFHVKQKDGQRQRVSRETLRPAPHACFT
ncbi:hypothetical protein BRAO375_600043 [Bradyrhizobium sp. ORS 375]|nr:hypothetical protein BRAO375_600043 [Bradyrhizobium sp. ORS 375]